MRQFCDVYTGSDGKTPIKVGIQMDAEEFLDSLFDKVEVYLKVNKMPNIVRIFFGGTFTHQIVCAKGCGLSKFLIYFYFIIFF
jgi:hypothetical protein